VSLRIKTDDVSAEKEEASAATWSLQQSSPTGRRWSTAYSGSLATRCRRSVTLGSPSGGAVLG